MKTLKTISIVMFEGGVYRRTIENEFERDQYVWWEKRASICWISATEIEHQKLEREFRDEKID